MTQLGNYDTFPICNELKNLFDNESIDFLKHLVTMGHDIGCYNDYEYEWWIGFVEWYKTGKEDKNEN